MTNPTPTTEEREQFEAAWRAEYVYHGEIFKRSGILPERYANTRVQDGWLMWQAARRTAPDVRAMAPTECAWTLGDDFETTIWYTQCGNAHVFTEDGPKENDARFCCYCGGALKEIRALAAKKDET